MARKRDLKPSFFTDAELADCHSYGMLTFAGLWCHADRDGRLKDEPRELKVKILPYFDVDFDGVLNDLNDGGFITRYEVDGKRYIQVENFTEHQNPHPKEPSLNYPANPHGCQEPCKEIANPVLQLPRARESVLEARGEKEEKGEPSKASLNSTLRDLERTWPKERCRDGDRPQRDSALFDLRFDLPADLIDLARHYIEAHAFASGAVAGCPNLHRWIREKRWLEPLPSRSTKSKVDPQFAHLDQTMEVAS